MFPLVEPRQRPERFLLNRFSPLAESAAFLGLGGFDAAGSVWYPDARRLLGEVPNDGTLTNMDPATDWVWSPELGRWVTYHDRAVARQFILTTLATWPTSWTFAAWVRFLGSSTSADEFSLLGSATAFSGQVQLNSSTIEDAAWHHLAFTLAGTDVSLYTDGALTTSGTLAANTHRMIRYHANNNQWQVWGGNGGSAIQFGDTPHTTTDAWTGGIGDPSLWSRVLSPAEISALADPSNVMLSVGGVPLILPPHRVSFPAAVAEPSGFKPYWLRRATQIIGGGVA